MGNKSQSKGYPGMNPLFHPGMNPFFRPGMNPQAAPFHYPWRQPGGSCFGSPCKPRQPCCSGCGGHPVTVPSVYPVNPYCPPPHLGPYPDYVYNPQLSGCPWYMWLVCAASVGAAAGACAVDPFLCFEAIDAAITLGCWDCLPDEVTEIVCFFCRTWGPLCPETIRARCHIGQGNGGCGCRKKSNPCSKPQQPCWSGCGGNQVTVPFVWPGNPYCPPPNLGPYPDYVYHPQLSGCPWYRWLACSPLITAAAAACKNTESPEACFEAVGTAIAAGCWDCFPDDLKAAVCQLCNQHAQCPEAIRARCEAAPANGDCGCQDQTDD